MTHLTVWLLWTALGAGELVANLSVGTGAPLKLGRPLELSIVLTNGSSEVVELGLPERIPVAFLVTRDDGSSAVSCLRPELVGKVESNSLPVHGRVNFKLRCRQFDLSPVGTSLSPGRYVVRLMPAPVTRTTGVLRFAPVDASFEVRGPDGAPPSRAPSKVSSAGLELEFVDQSSQRQTIYGGALRSDGTSSVSTRESFGVVVRMRALGKPVQLLALDLFARPVRATPQAEPTEPRRTKSGGCITSGAAPFDAWEATGEPEQLWAAHVGQIGAAGPWDATVPKKPIDLAVNAMANDATTRLRTEAHTYLVRVIDSRMRVSWIESPGLTFAEVTCAAP